MVPDRTRQISMKTHETGLCPGVEVIGLPQKKFARLTLYSNWRHFRPHNGNLRLDGGLLWLHGAPHWLSGAAQGGTFTHRRGDGRRRNCWGRMVRGLLSGRGRRGRQVGGGRGWQGAATRSMGQPLRQAGWKRSRKFVFPHRRR